MLTIEEFIKYHHLLGQFDKEIHNLLENKSFPPNLETTTIYLLRELSLYRDEVDKYIKDNQ